MKTNLSILLIGLAMVLPILSIGQSSGFNDAVLAYNAENYSKAIQLYEELLLDGNISDEIYYNLGIAYLKDDQIGKSIVNLERSLLLESNNKRSKVALNTAKEMVAIQVTKIPDFILWTGYQSFAKLFNSTIWGFFQIVFAIVALILIYIILILKRDARLLYFLLGLCSFLAMISFYNAGMQKLKLVDSKEAIVMVKSDYLYKGADNRSDVVSDISEGVKVYILDKIGEWYKVQLEDKDIGWIETKKVEII